MKVALFAWWRSIGKWIEFVGLATKLSFSLECGLRVPGMLSLG